MARSTPWPLGGEDLVQKQLVGHRLHIPKHHQPGLYLIPAPDMHMQGIDSCQ